MFKEETTFIQFYDHANNQLVLYFMRLIFEVKVPTGALELQFQDSSSSWKLWDDNQDRNSLLGLHFLD